MDLSHYRTLFIAESRDYLKEIGSCAVTLEQVPSDRNAIDSLFRAAHSLKGMAATMEYDPIVGLSHSMEELMVRVRNGALPFRPAIADLLLEGVDLLEGMLSDLEAERSLRRADDLSQRLSGYCTQPEAPAPQPRPEVTTERTGELAVQAATIKVKTELLDHLINLTGELITNKYRLLSLGRELASPPLDEALAENSRLLRLLHDEVMQVRLMPFEVICDRLQRSVRDIAKKCGKEVQLILQGREIGLDRSILEQLAEPLNHILRNAVDHGLETRAERQALGKPQGGCVSLEVSRDRDQVVITVNDDGRGMEPAGIIAAALGKGVISAEEAETLTPRQALMLIVTPGFSTAATVTEVSGRGVGMDVVHAAILRLGGTLAIESEPGKGSSFTLRLPMTIAIIHALLVRCGRLKVAVPVNGVQRSVELKREQVITEGGRQFFELEGEVVPLISLNRTLGVPMSRFRGGIVPLFVTEAKGRRVGLVVDELLGQHELFIRPLGRPLGKLRGVAGAAILGDGEVITVLDLAHL